jgi:hypothetical protein
LEIVESKKMNLYLYSIIINKMSFTDLTIEDYTGKSVVVQGDTRKYKEDLKKLGGKYNGRLKNGPGWIFPKTSESDILLFMKNGKRLVTAEEAKEGEERSKQRAQEWDKQQKQEVTRKPKAYTPEEDKGFSVRNTLPTLSEYGALIGMISEISLKINKIDHSLSLILTKEQKKELEVLMKPPEKKTVVKKIVKRKTETKSDNSDTDLSSDEEEIAPRKRLMRG